MRILFYSLLCVMLPLASVAATQDYAVVDMKKLMQESTAAKDIKAKISKQRDSYKDEIKKQEDELRESDKQLADKRAILSPQAFEEQRAAFKEQLIKVQRDVQVKRAQLDQSLKDALVIVQKQINGIIKDLASEKKFIIAVPVSQTLYASDKLDITADVLAQLNKNLPTVKVNTN